VAGTITLPAICEAHTCMEKTLVKTLDEDLDYRIGRSIPKGDSCCEHILSRRRVGRDDGR
jgi:hypothetical protein